MARRGTGLVLLTLALVSLSASAEDRLSKKQVSANGLYTIYLRQSAPNSCLIIALKDGNPYWQLAQCIGSVDDQFFISNNGDRFWVVKTLAEMKKAKKAQPKWFGSTVLYLYDKEGQLKSTRSAGPLVPKTSWGDVRMLAGHAMWLEGVNGVPGVGPRVNDQNQLEVDAVGHRTWKLSFDEGKKDDAPKDGGSQLP